MKVIINADDLGFSRPVNDAIFDLMSRGKITSATIMANGGAVQEAARRVREFSKCSFGVHLNLTEFFPITKHAGLSRLLDRDGRFQGKAIRSVKINSELREAVFEELSGQIQRVIDLGVEVSHLDSHHHVHTVAGLLGVVKRLQKRFGIRKVRLTMNIYPPDLPVSRKLLAAKWLWNFGMRRWYRTITTEGFTGFQGFCATRAQQLMRYRSVELMVHPGAEIFAKETAMLEEDWRGLMEFGVELVNYKELA